MERRLTEGINVVFIRRRCGEIDSHGIVIACVIKPLFLIGIEIKTIGIKEFTYLTRITWMIQKRVFIEIISIRWICTQLITNRNSTRFGITL